MPVKFADVVVTDDDVALLAQAVGPSGVACDRGLGVKNNVVIDSIVYQADSNPAGPGSGSGHHCRSRLKTSRGYKAVNWRVEQPKPGKLPKPRTGPIPRRPAFEWFCLSCTIPRRDGGIEPGDIGGRFGLAQVVLLVWAARSALGEHDGSPPAAIEASN